MLETIKNQYKSGRSLTQNKHYSIINRNHWPRYLWDLYPVTQEFYHELNPYFVSALPRIEYLKFAPLITVKDGYVPFATYVLNNFNNLAKTKVLHLIHPELAPIIPDNLREHFACWHVSHPKKIKLTEAKKVIVFGIMAEQYLGNFDAVARKLEALKDLSPETKIEAYFPLRRDPLKEAEIDKENVFIHQAVDLLRSYLPKHQIKYLTSEKLLEQPDFQGTYFLDLAFDRFLISDNYLHYFVCSRGGSVNMISAEAPADSVFSLELSLHHQLHVTPLPKTESIFVDMLFHKKQYPSRELEKDPMFQAILRERLNNN